MKPLDVVKIVEDLTYQNINIEPMIRDLKVESFYFTLCADITANKAHEASRKGKIVLRYQQGRLPKIGTESRDIAIGF